MKFEIRRAVPSDLPGIMRIMRSSPDPLHPDWYITDEEPFIRERMSEDGSSTENGFTLVAQSSDGNITGYFVVTYPTLEKNLGNFLSYSEEQLGQTVIMDTTAVDARYRGYGLQRKMAEAAEASIDKKDVRYLLCMIHPDNIYSLSNMKKLGYIPRDEVEYHGRRRYILEKKLIYYGK